MADDRVALAYALADQMFEGDLQARKAIERTGEAALLAWQSWAARTGNRGLYSVLEQCDRCAFGERWRQLAAVYAENGSVGVFDLLRRQQQPAAVPPEPER